MLDASVQFSDVLGGRIASYAVTRDLTLGPGEQFEQTGRWGLNTFERLLDLDPDDVVVTTCVRVAISDEGERIEFSEEPGLRSEQPTNNNVEIRGAAFMLAMAAACPTNDNQLAIDAAQSIFDDAGYTDYAAADMFDTLKRSAESEEAGNPALACGLLERALE
ncbi:hypothetical protein ABWH92_12405 [Ahrensia marina]|uniref:hypothetical protein n=1 Tax=Ahrensia marina TaxID=1514904 RepID=UPI0035CF302D